MGKIYHLNVGCGDATVIQTDTATFLVDCHNIELHRNLLPASKILRGVFITHAHRDHYSGLDFLKRNGYGIQYLIYSPYQRRNDDNSLTIEEWTEFNALKNHFGSLGTKLYSPHRQEKWDSPWWGTDGIQFWILGPASHLTANQTREVHDGCLVFQAHLGNRRCVFTGDASDANLAHIASHTSNICGDILHASHHGSINGAEMSFIKSCAPAYTIISTCVGVHDNVPHPTALTRYESHTSKTVFRTDQAGMVTSTF
ncbi:MAG: hypothetical protein PHZ00_06305 [Candidatus Peribacteraceae bacterium]|nr:hypothetical protein [Candidatus Peribacteraceae bacterium]